MCCDFHIGLNFPKKRFSCKKTCQKLIAPKKIGGKGKGKKGRNSKRKVGKKGKKGKKRVGKKKSKKNI